MRILVTGDLHGNKPNIYYEGFDAIIAPGDFCSSEEIRKYEFQALRQRLQNPDSKVKWYDLIDKGEARKMIKISLKDGREILEYLNSFNVPVYIVPGNADFAPTKEQEWKFLKQNYYRKLIDGLENVIDVYHKLVNW